MSAKAKRRAGRPALELIETAVQLLRTAPTGVLLSYYAGSIPCVLGLLYFWADMSRGAFARDHLIEAALSMALLYVWMKCWHSVFASKLHAFLIQERDSDWTFSRVIRLALVQVAIQPCGLFVRLLAAQVLIPYVWTYAFYQNVGILGNGKRAGIGEVVREAAQQASLWPRQAYGLIFCISAFGIFTWFNIVIAFAAAPQLLNRFFGIQTVFLQDWMTMLNTTTLAGTLAVLYLCLDPLRKAVFVLRCFHGASLKSGEDLRVELKSWGKSLRPAAAVLLAALCLLGSLTPARAAETKPVQIESAELNDAMEKVLQRREYAWRLPRADRPQEEEGWLETFINALKKRMKELIREAFEWAGKIMDWLRKLFDRPSKEEEASSRASINWSVAARWTLIILVVALAVIVGVLLWRWHKGRRRTDVAVATPVAVVPDLNEDSVTADQLPEDGWLRLARELMDKGELRLALRAFYLATLAHLGHRELIRLARHKSNHDYDRELQRRARGNAGLISAFDENLFTFERSWYGEHAVTPVTLDDFAQNIERMRTC